jgi:SAM-dependent methyltransferase
MIQTLAKTAIHTVSGNRKFYYKELANVAINNRGKTVLELGSGKQVSGRYTYSARHLFPTAKEFICTDINPDFGHQVLDVTTMKTKNKYDIILCLNVLEHVYEFQKAVNNMHRALKTKGILCVALPFTFPLHDEPGDYWRFTEHALRKMLSSFSKVEIKPQRSRKLPTGYFVIARK